MFGPASRLAREHDEFISKGQSSRFTALLEAAPPEEAARFIDRMDADRQGEILSKLRSECVAGLLMQFPHARAAALLRLMPSPCAATALQLLPSNDQVDLVAALGDDAKVILDELPAGASQRLLRLSVFQENTAGGLMVSEYLSYREKLTVAMVIDDLRANSGQYSRFDVQYVYVVDDQDRLVGTLRLRDLLLLSWDYVIEGVMLPTPEMVAADTTLDRLQQMFDRIGYLGLPVIDDAQRLLGVVLKVDVEESLAQRNERTYLLMSGLLGGDELRSMRWTARLARRAPWLAVSLLLSVTAASVIGWYEETLAGVISLAMFLPVISGVGGNAGNQSMALSIRELSLGLIEPHEFSWVIVKEMRVALFNGLLMGSLLGLAATLWQKDWMLGLVLAIAILASTILASILGGIIPLALKHLGWDPALASGPLLFTTVDLCGFLLTLALADLVLL